MNVTDSQDSHGLVRRKAVVARGVSDEVLSAQVREGSLLHVGYGDYLVTESLPTDRFARRDEIYRLRCLACATAGRSTDLVLSHQSAAAFHRLSMLKPDLSRIHLVNTHRGRGSILTARHVHPGPVADTAVAIVDGVKVTSLVRTAIDVACADGTFAGALAVLDRARALGATATELKAELDAHRRVGRSLTTLALTYADPLSANVGESWSRAQMIDGGLPVPQLQRKYVLPDQDAFVDFDFDGVLVGEFDGLQKYGRGMRRAGEGADDAVIREKLRQDQIEALGPKVVRWTWADLERHRVVPLIRYWINRLRPAESA